MTASSSMLWCGHATTVTLDPDVEAKLQEVARERGVSFREALNSAVCAGLMAARGA